MRVLFRSALASVGLAAALAGLAPTNAGAGGTVTILILKEHGIGSAAQAQPFVDQLVALAKTQSGWADAKGSYQTTRSAAEKYVQSDKPHFGILSLAAFLAFQSKYNLEVIGQVNSSRAGGQQYHLISKSATDLAGCKGKRLASDHADDTKFIDKVVAGGSFKLADFTLVTTTRPVQTIKKVANDEAECALIDDAQYAELSKMEGVAGVKSVWKSATFPAMVMAAFPESPAAERKGFQANLSKLCEGGGATTCKEVGVQSFKAAGAADYAAVVTAYNK